MSVYCAALKHGRKKRVNELRRQNVRSREARPKHTHTHTNAHSDKYKRVCVSTYVHMMPRVPRVCMFVYPTATTTTTTTALARSRGIRIRIQITIIAQHMHTQRPSSKHRCLCMHTHITYICQANVEASRCIVLCTRPRTHIKTALHIAIV